MIMNRTPQTVSRTPYSLPDIYPHPTRLQAGALISLCTTPPHETPAYAWIAPHEDPALWTLYWLSGPRTGQTEATLCDALYESLHQDALTVFANNVDSVSAAAALVDDQTSDPTTRPASYDISDDPGRTIAPHTIDVTDLSFHREFSLEPVQTFLNHPLVDHDRGGTNIHIASFTARYRGDIVAVATLENPNSRYRDNGTTVQLSRYAAHPNRPPNTASWLLSRVFTWARLNGFARLLTYAGQSYDNTGQIYKALGLTLEKPPEQATGSGYTNRGQNRDSWSDYTKHTYIGLQTVGDTHPTRALPLSEVPDTREDLPEETTTTLRNGAIHYPDPTSGAPRCTGIRIEFEDRPSPRQTTLPGTQTNPSDLTEWDHLRGAFTTPPLTGPEERVPSSDWRWVVADTAPNYVASVFDRHGTRTDLPEPYRRPHLDRLDRPFAVVVQSAQSSAPLAAAVVERPRNVERPPRVLAFTIHPAVTYPRNLGAWLLRRLQTWAELSNAAALDTATVPENIVRHAGLDSLGPPPATGDAQATA